MPRPRRPRPNTLIRLKHDALIDEVTNLDEDSDEFRRLKRHVARLIADYQRDWTARRGPGRRSEATRNRLVIDIARQFQIHAGWTLADRQDYRWHLVEYLARVLVPNDIFPPSAARLLRVIPKSLRVPRS